MSDEHVVRFMLMVLYYNTVPTGQSVM